MGNNNCYSQDNELTWYDWQLDGAPQTAAGVYVEADPIPQKTIPTCIAGKFFQGDRVIRGSVVR